MAMHHFMNCLLLCFGPHFLLYQATKLKDDNALKPCGFSGLFYCLTQLIKIMVMATILPSFHEGETFGIYQELIKLPVSVVDFIGLQFALQRPYLGRFDHHVRILAVTLGWSVAESVMTYLVPLWLGARGLEFSWEYLEMGIASNVNLLLLLGFAGAVWLYTRTDLESSSRPLVLVSIFTYLILPALTRFLAWKLVLGKWAIDLIRLGVAIVTGYAARVMVRRYTARKSK